MNTAERFLSAFRAKRAEEAQQESAEAADLRANLQGLIEHPGWAIMTKHLTTARDVLYRKMEDGSATEYDRAFCKLCRQLLEGPAGLIEAATTILRDAATPR